MLSVVVGNADLIPTIGVSPIVMTASFAALRMARLGKMGGAKNAAMTVIALVTKNASMLIPESFLCL